MTEEFRTILINSCFILDLKASTKEGVIEEMVNALAEEGKIRRKEEVLAAIIEREQKMSTGMSEEIAIPHARTSAVSELVSVFAMKRTGVDFKSLDGKLSKIFIMTVSPPTNTERYVRYLGTMGRILKSADLREKLLGAVTKEDVINILVP